MARIIKLIFLLAIFIFGLSFAVVNSHPVTFKYYFGTVELPLSLLLAFCLALGIVIGLLAGFGALFKAKHEMSTLRKTTRTMEKELENLRSLPLKDKP